MTPVFLDTSFLLALTLPRDELHTRAIAMRARQKDPLLTTEYVLVEFLDAMSRPVHRGNAVRVVQEIRRSGNVEVVAASTRLLEEGVLLFETRQDKPWGLTDCLSFVVMREQGVTDALTSDRHFEQAGFKALLRT